MQKLLTYNKKTEKNQSKTNDTVRPEYKVDAIDYTKIKVDYKTSFETNRVSFRTFLNEFFLVIGVILLLLIAVFLIFSKVFVAFNPDASTIFGFGAIIFGLIIGFFRKFSDFM